MNPTDSKEQFVEEFELDVNDSIDDFIRELEAKEKDLQISPAETVVEIEEYEIADNSSATAAPDESVQPAVSQALPQKPAPVQSEELQKINKELEEFRRQVRQLERERDEMREILSRRQNDFENFRKRVEREKNETLRGMVSDLASRMLPVIDNLNRAVESVAEAPGEKSSDFLNFLDGIVMVNRQLNEVLADMGIEPILSVGEPFDPHLHEAVATEKNEKVAPNTVTAEFLRGYRLGEKVIRHAMVQVAIGGSADLNLKTNDDDNLIDF
jgi:Molecular chaperone GrpE (heat shock protein)